MTFLTPFLAATLLTVPQPPDCAPVSRPTTQRVFTNADLDRIAACRALQEGAAPTPRGDGDASVTDDATPMKSRRSTRASGSTSGGNPGLQQSDALEADWRARWRSVDQKAKKLRREARELRAEAAAAPRDPKKPVVGRRAPSVLLTRAEALEAEARDLLSEFEEMARRQGALPGWLRPKGH